MGTVTNSIGLVGDVQLQKTLLSLSDNIAKAVMKPAILAGLKPVQIQAKANAAPGSVLSSQASGLMRKAIKTSARARKDKVSGRVYVDRKTEGMIHGKRHVPGFIAHLVEFGHGGPHPAPAHPFLRSAMDTKKQAAMEAVTAKARELIPAAVAKART